MSISGILLLNAEIRKDLDAAKYTNRTVRSLLSHLIASASASNHLISSASASNHLIANASASNHLIASASIPGNLIASASIPNHPFDVQPWPEEARPKVEMPV